MINLDPIKARLAAVPTPLWGEFCESGDWWIQQIDDEGSPIGEIICSSNPDDMTQEVADFIVAAPADIAALLNDVERMRRALEAVCYFWERDPEAFGDEASVTSMAGKFAAVAHQCQVALRGDDNA